MLGVFFFSNLQIWLIRWTGCETEPSRELRERTDSAGFFTHTHALTHTYTHRTHVGRHVQSWKALFPRKFKNIQNKDGLFFSIWWNSQGKNLFFVLENVKKKKNGTKRAPSSLSYQLRLLTFSSDTTHTLCPVHLPFSPMGTRGISPSIGLLSSSDCNAIFLSISQGLCYKQCRTTSRSDFSGEFN